MSGETRKAVTPDVLDLYCKQLTEIKHRSFVIGEIFTRERHGTPFPATDVELIYLQFRKILELIALASLVVNKDEYSKVRKQFENDWNAKRILESLEKANPRFYPKASRQILDEKTGRPISLEPIVSGFLTKKEFLELYQMSSEILHSRNPFLRELDLEIYKSRTNEWAGKIATLLNHHEIHLHGTTN